MRETSKHQLWSKVVLKAAFHGVGVKHLICTEMWCTKSLPLCQGEPVSAAPTEKESCPKFSSKKYLVLEPPPLTTELLGTAVLGGIRLKGIIFLLMERLALGSLFFMCFCTFPKKVRSHLGGWEVAAVSGATHSSAPLLWRWCKGVLEGCCGFLTLSGPWNRCLWWGRAKTFKETVLCEPEECCPDGMQKWCSDVWLLPL